MKNILTFCFIIASSTILFTSCKKETHVDTSTTSPTVYVYGTANNIPVYWKNGVVSSLSTNMVTADNPGSFFVSGNNVYVAGGSSLDYDVSGSAEYLENGAVKTLPDSTGKAFANSVFVSGNDVYVAGISYYQYGGSNVPYTTPTATYPTGGYVATYWKNGTAAILPSIGFIGLDKGFANEFYSDYVSSIFVSGNDVYVTGGSHEAQLGVASSYHYARYWKNGVSTDLVNGLVSVDTSSSTVITYPTTTSIYVSGTDVYVAGIETGDDGTQQALYWKNGTAVFLTSGAPTSSNRSQASSIFVSGSDVYVAGYETVNGTVCATYWKNGVATNLTTGTSSSAANSIVVSGGNVYVAGSATINDSYYAVYWRNGALVQLGVNATASSIFVQ